MDKVERVKLSDLKPDRKNANLHTERGVYMVNTSLSRHGAGRSILIDKDNEIIAGNLTAEQAADIGIDDVLIVETDGRTLIAVKRTDLDLDDPESGARQLAYADNRSAEVSIEFDFEQIAEDIEAGIDLSDYFMDYELEGLAPLEGSDEPVASDGSLLSLVDVTIDEPVHQVESGDVWRLGHHVLLCVNVMRGWREWKKYLEGDAIFAPYPGPFVALSEKANAVPLVLVQPEPYIAGHIIDRYAEINGEDSVAKNSG